MTKKKAEVALAEGAAALPAADHQVTHAREFTNIEVEGLTLWNALQDAGNETLARELLDAVLMHEHYTSLLPSNQGDRSADQNTKQARFQARAAALLEAARDFLATTPKTTGIPKGE